MQIAELGVYIQINPDAWSNESPFIYSAIPALHTTATYWDTTLGAASEDNYNRIYIAGFIRGAFDKYTSTASLAACEALEKAFYWDNTNQILYVHFEHDYNPWNALFSYEILHGYTNGELIYIDDVAYLPLLNSSIPIRQQEDILEYNKLSFVSGSINLDNTGGILDFYIDLELYNNDAFLGYIDPDDMVRDSFGILTATRADIQRTQAFYIEKYDCGITEIEFALQDIRKAGDTTIPILEFTEADYPDIEEEVIGEKIPVAFGTIREMTAYAVNGNDITHVQFRAAVEMVSFGTIEVSIDGVWTAVTPIGSTPANGEFVLLDTDARDDGGSGAIRAVRLLGAEGVANTTAGDIIVALNLLGLNIPFTDTFYDTTEWASECASLSSIGIVFNKGILLSEAIRLIQNACNVGFRYEINVDGQRTIRIDDESRELIGTLSNTNISNRYELKTESDPEKVYAQIKVQYAPSFLTDKYLDVKNIDYYDSVSQTYKTYRELLRPTYLTSEAEAITKAAADAETFKKIPRFVTVVIDTPNKIDRELFLKLRIFDILKAEITTSNSVDLETNTVEGREFYGIQAGKVVSIAPDPDQNKNTVVLKLIPDYVETIFFDFTKRTGQDTIDFTQTAGQTVLDFTGDN